jgi:hydroxymethylpyrimidine pyrophosphatase-like HAD family hydrolase
VRFLALATDYDGTLARHGRVDGATLRALARLRATGRRLILVSGRELEDLRGVFDRLDLFDRAVLENGALLHRPADGSERLLGGPPPAEFVALLKAKGAERVSAGRCVVATWLPHDEAARAAIRELGLDLRIILNKRAVMVLPAGVDKASGLRVALEELGVPAGATVGVGDAENDQAFLDACGLSAAVANALPGLKGRAGVVLSGDHGAGVAELIDRLIADDPA